MQKKKQESEEILNMKELDFENLGFGLSKDDVEGLDKIPNPKPKGRNDALKGLVDLFLKDLKLQLRRGTRRS